MGQSSLYKFGTGIASNVDVVSDDTRDLGNVDIGAFGSSVEITTPSNSYRLGEVAVHNTVATDISAALESTASSDRLVATTRNQSSTTSVTHDVANALGANPVPEGVSVLFQADPSNGSNVPVDNIVLTAGDRLELDITNTNVVSTGGSGTINVHFEG